ncbi:BatD family protein [Legionella shakespearei]|uniref:KQDN repeat-containing protein n=1 Tax=Legionella shakespearei DSM 23087 TaxID=1122169 RepID=A0A0W0YKY7_9GAMM|nr:BatD family protein [Legionella shakespearei]KTD57495.1 KQDN repeat-containing protein [Legionella shakespearei DSM 23087]
MKKLLLVFLCFFSCVVLAEIQVEVEPSQVTMGDVFKLTLTQDNAQGGGVPDLTALQKDFVILGTERQINYAIVNGQAESASQWVITLKALKPGILTIPAIKFGADKTNPVTINVSENAQDQDSQLDPSRQDDIMITTEVDEKKPYINQQVLYTVKLYTNKRLLDANYQGPKVENALLIPLGDAKRYHSIQNNINYVVEEQSYAIFPQKSGTLTITAPTFTGLVYDIHPQRVQATDKPISLSVQPVPAQFKGKPWLPAKAVKLTEQYENTSQTLGQGGTLTRNVTMEGIGIPAQLLPTLNFEETDAFSVYPEKGADRNQVKQGELVSQTEIKVTYLFNKAGKVTIPELRLPWFNIETGKEEFAVLAPRSMDITPAATQPDKVAAKADSQGTVRPSSTVSDSTSQNSLSWAWIAAILFACAWIITLGLWFWQRRSPSRSINKRQDKKALDELAKACSTCNPQKARDALLHWASFNWPDATVLNLTDLSKLVRDAHLKKQLHILSQALYQGKDKTLWRGDELLRAVKALKRANAAKKSAPNVLPPINPF